MGTLSNECNILKITKLNGHWKFKYVPEEVFISIARQLRKLPGSDNAWGHIQYSLDLILSIEQ